MPPFNRRVLVFVLVLVLTACGGQRSERSSDLVDLLVDVPTPNLSTFEEAVRRQLETDAQALDDLLETGDASPTELATTFGELGQRYHVYELYEAAEASYQNAHLLAPGEFRWAYYLAVLLQTTGQFEEAARMFEAALGQKPGDLTSHVRLGQVYLERDRAADARRHLETALEIDPECALAHYFLGQVAAAGGEFAAAVDHFTSVARLQPDASILHYPLAQAYQGLGESEKAAHHLGLMGSEEVRIEDPLMYALEDLRTGAAALIRRGARAQIDGAWEAALEEYRKAVEADPRNPEARQGVAAVLAHQGDYDGALKQYEKALELGADNALVHFNLAGALALNGRIDEAISHYERVFELDPQHREAPFALASVLVQAGRRGEAIARYRNLLDGNPGNVRVHLELAALMAGEGDREGARELGERVLTLDASANEKARAHLSLAALASEAGRFDEAIAHYQQASAEAPGLAAPQFALGNLLGGQGRFREAAAAYRRTLELDPQSSAARLGEATALLLAGDPAAARKRLEEGLAAEPGNGDLALALARLLATSQNATVRDGRRALELAEALFASAQSVETAEAMALALAENGRFEDAVSWQRRVVSGLRESGAAGENVARAAAYLESFERRQPIRQ